MLGFIVICGLLVGLYFYDPPKGICDIQMEEITNRLNKGFFVDDHDGSYGKSAQAALDFCFTTNSPGGCHDLFTRLNFFEKIVKSLPTECGTSEAAGSVRKVLIKSLKLFGQIGWGEKPPINKYNKTSWLDTADLGLYCRLKRQYWRLYGKEDWKNFTWSVIPGLPEANTLEKKKKWELSLYSYNCKGLY